MKISSQTFQSIVTTLRSDPRPNTSREKRTQPRVGIRGHVDIVPAGPGSFAFIAPVAGAAKAEVMVRDLSGTGLGFLHAAPLQLGSQFLLLLEAGKSDKAAAPPPSVLCTVVRCHPVGDRLFSIGATFVREFALAG